MLSKILAPLTTATSAGVALRYLTAMAGSILAILGILGWLSPEQVEALSKQVPDLLAAIGGLAAILIPIYATLTKSSSDKAAEAARAIDREVPAQATVLIKTPAGQPDIVVPGK